ncbi:single-stranded-DNA-specific exonuclease RecJ [Candidatus Parcubacteria bacterium]|nr:single-stranded-DNA-specific exonuclease RecJ [Candidatus Parcubacteria bacterium]
MNYLIKDELKSDDREKLKEYSDLIAHLLFHRGVTNKEDAQDFIDIDYEKHTHNPFELKDIEKALTRVLSVIENNEKICVFSDYDADGIPGAVVLTDFFKKIGYDNFYTYIPHRNREGFGLNNSAIKKIIDKEVGTTIADKENQQDTKILITIDCGISDVEQINTATDSGIDVIVTDHHDPNGHKSKAFAVINPKQPECNYPDPNLCGAGVIFKFVQAAILKIREEKENIKEKDNFWHSVEIQEGWEKWLLDMVGIATLSDMVPLVGENRVFAKYGLLVMSKSPRKGFQKLLKKGGINQLKINEEDVGFTISPRINAASRMDSPELAFQMLSTLDDVEADQTVKHLDKINNERKGHVAAIVREIHKKIKERKILDSDGKEKDALGEILVFGNPKWQPSLMGLVASKLVDEFDKPAFIWGRGESDTIKGSCRSNGSLNLVELMNNVDKGIIFQYGGHEMAGGFEVTDQGIYDLEKALNEAQTKTLLNKDGDLGKIKIDKVVSVDDLDWNLFNEINKLSPFGVGNDKPVFMIKDGEIEKVEFFGKEKNHLKIILKKKNGRKIPAIQFFIKEKDKNKISDKTKVDLIVNLENSNFAGFNELRLRIVEIL